MFHNLGWGWGGTLLALVALVAVPAPLIVSPEARTNYETAPDLSTTLMDGQMFKYGKRLREKYQFDG
jgi:hypothetical protein